MITRRTSLLATMALCGLAFSAPAARAAAVGQPAPAFSATDSNGKTVTLQQFRGKHVVLEWHNQDCPFVVKHYKSGNLPKLQREWTQKGVVWLVVISSAPGKQGHVDGAGANADMKLYLAPTLANGRYFLTSSGADRSLHLPVELVR